MNRLIILSILITAICSLFNVAFSIEINYKKHQEFFDDSEGGVWEQDIVYPVVKKGDRRSIKKINSKIKAILEKYSCNPKAELFFTSNVTLNNGSILSLRYNSMYRCRSMPNVSSYDGGVSFSISNGEPLSLENEIVDKASYDLLKELVLKRLSDEIKLKVKNATLCKNPRISNEFYLKDNSIVFIEFFVEHYKDFCEVGVSFPINDITEYIRKESAILGTNQDIDISKVSIAHKASLKYFRQKNLEGAINILEPLFGSQDFYKYDISNKSVLNALNDYGFFLGEAKRYIESVEILKYITKVSPERIVAYINLGDAYYGNNEANKAKQAYQTYVDLMKKSDKQKRIPKRVYDRLK